MDLNAGGAWASIQILHGSQSYQYGPYMGLYVRPAWVSVWILHGSQRAPMLGTKWALDGSECGPWMDLNLVCQMGLKLALA